MQHGYRKTSVDEIARRAGVAKGTVYLYFDKKASLLMHAMAREKEVLFERLRPVLDGTLRDEARLHFYVKTLLTCGRDLPLLARLMSGGGEALVVLDEIDPQLMERATELGEQWLMSLVEDAAPYEFDAQQRRERANVLNTLRWFVTMLLDERIRGGRDLDALAETMADVLVYGLVTRPPGQEDMLDREEEEP
ncbi:MAG TPA: TetR/AcrR family transcriptional regulator [Polyangiaceae bacterium]|nr:TetR/AcrR family transcriptional regulator [Polyangiaceae bacterium]